MRLLLTLLVIGSVLGYSKPLYSGCKPTIIAVLDTGFGYLGQGKEAKLCQFGHKDFSIDQKFVKNYGTKDKLPLDMHAHGTNVAGIIDGYARVSHVNYCIVVIKYYSEKQSGFQNLTASTKAIRYATKLGAAYINYSGGGPERDAEEISAVKKFLDGGGVFVAAAGNENENIDYSENKYYPASADSRVISVGNKYATGSKYPSSNYGKSVKRWEVGVYVKVYNITMTGTSQATAIATGKIVSERKNSCDIGF